MLLFSTPAAAQGLLDPAEVAPRVQVEAELFTSGAITSTDVETTSAFEVQRAEAGGVAALAGG